MLCTCALIWFGTNSLFQASELRESCCMPCPVSQTLHHTMACAVPGSQQSVAALNTGLESMPGMHTELTEHVLNCFQPSLHLEPHWHCAAFIAPIFWRQIACTSHAHRMHACTIWNGNGNPAVMRKLLQCSACNFPVANWQDAVKCLATSHQPLPSAKVLAWLMPHGPQCLCYLRKMKQTAELCSLVACTTHSSFSVL